MSRANVLALEGDPPSGAYNVGTAVETTVNELYELLQDLSGEDLPARHGPAKSGEQLRSSIDPARASRIFGWHPQVQLAAGLEETLRFVEAH
jgi:UDP-glucose 4-epimerase